jgi:hypothetical protein
MRWSWLWQAVHGEAQRNPWRSSAAVLFSGLCVPHELDTEIDL